MTKSTIEKAVRELNRELEKVNERRSQLMDSINRCKICANTQSMIINVLKILHTKQSMNVNFVEAQGGNRL